MLVVFFLSATFILIKIIRSLQTAYISIKGRIAIVRIHSFVQQDKQ